MIAISISKLSNNQTLPQPSANNTWRPDPTAYAETVEVDGDGAYLVEFVGSDADGLAHNHLVGEFVKELVGSTTSDLFCSVVSLGRHIV